MRLNDLQSKRDIAYSLITEIPHIFCPKPHGAFYLLPDVSYYFGKTLRCKDGSTVKISNAHELCLELLREEQVALVPGDAFGADFCVRISYATSSDVIKESMKRFRSFLHRLL